MCEADMYLATHTSGLPGVHGISGLVIKEYNYTHQLPSCILTTVSASVTHL